MPLINFGSILSFALEIEEQNKEFIATTVDSADSSDQKDLFEKLGKNCSRRIKELERVRRENVTEMILESIEGFTEDSYLIELGGEKANKSAEIARSLYERTVRYYKDASLKLKGQSEVSRSLKTLGKKINRDLDLL